MALPLTDYSTNRQHAVPQNIMSVEFKLIGSMTVRQFVYAATGIIGAYLIYSSQIPFIFKWPLVVIVAFAGIGFAFLPVQDRGMDIWIRNFMFAISRPTLRIWEKEPLPPNFLLSDYATALRNEVVVVAPAASRAKLMEYLQESKPLHAKNKLDVAEELFLEHLNFSAPTPQKTITTVVGGASLNVPLPSPIPAVAGRALKVETPQPAPPLYLPPRPTPTAVPTSNMLSSAKTSITEQVVDLKNLVDKIRHKPAGVLFELPKTVPLPPKTEEEVPPLLQAELKKLEIETHAAESAALAKKVEEKKQQEQMAKELEEMKQTIGNQRSEVGNLQDRGLKLDTEIRDSKLESNNLTSNIQHPRPTSNFQPPTSNPRPQPAAREITEEVTTAKNVSLTTTPNVINGVVKDATGKLLQGVIVIVKDEFGSPVRALKTNDLGQFVVSTPLPNGKYHVTVSQATKSFATMEVVTDGRVLLPLAFTSRDFNK